jgi:DNA-binding transcriptional LysR family regulator
VAVADARSVSRAARALYLTQPAVTRRMQRLESALGVTLCDRTRRPVTLTEAGQTVLERCRRVLDAVRDVRSSSDDERAPAREVRIGVAHALTELTLTQPVERLQRRFPHVSLSLSTGWTRDLLERVRARALDGAVILLPDDERMPAGIDATRLGRERLVVVGPREGRGPRFDGMASLGGVGWILNPEGCAARALLQRALARRTTLHPAPALDPTGDRRESPVKTQPCSMAFRHGFLQQGSVDTEKCIALMRNFIGSR